MPAAVHDQLLDSVPDGVFTVDSEWRITAFNRAAEQITGIRREEAVGRRHDQLPLGARLPGVHR